MSCDLKKLSIANGENFSLIALSLPTQPSNFHVTIIYDVSSNLQPANFLSALYFLPTDGVTVWSSNLFKSELVRPLINIIYVYTIYIRTATLDPG